MVTQTTTIAASPNLKSRGMTSLLFFGLLEGQWGPLSIYREGAAFAVGIKGYS